MRIGVIGTGNMGRAVGVRLAGLGHEVVFGARGDQGVEAARRAGHGARAGTNDAAANYGEVLIWTTRDADPASVLTDPDVLAGKIVVNLNNRDYAQDVQGGNWFGEAIAEAFQSHAPTARVVKALNTVAMEALDTSAEALQEAGAQIFIAGDDADAKRTVTGLLTDLGFEAVDVGTGAVALRAVEAIGDIIRVLMIAGGRGSRANLQLRMLPEPDLGLIGPRTASNYR